MKSQHSAMNFKSFNNEISIFGTNEVSNLQNPSAKKHHNFTKQQSMLIVGG